MPDKTNDTIIATVMEQLVAEGPQAMAQVITALMNLAMRMEREQFLGAGHYERSVDRRGYANGTKSELIDTPADTLSLDVPETAGTDEPFYPQALERGCRSCRAVMLAVAEMYVCGVSTRDVEPVLAEFGSRACHRPPSNGDPGQPRRRAARRAGLWGPRTWGNRWKAATLACDR